jgi:hypothetical protein
MSIHRAIAKWFWPDIFEQRDELYQEVERLHTKIESTHEVHVIVSIEQLNDLVDPWEAHFSKEVALRRSKELDTANKRAYQRRTAQVEQIVGQIRMKGLPSAAPYISPEDQMALCALNGLGEYVGRARFIVLSMPVGAPNREKIIEILRAKAAEEQGSAG